MFSLSSTTLTILISLVLLLSNSCHLAKATETQQQTCKIGPSTPTPCTNCSVCTGSPYASCCTLDSDHVVRGVLQMIDPNNEDCLIKMKEYMCASCDPKNQKYIVNGKLHMCNSRCLESNDICGPSATLSCVIFPDNTNCWSNANSLYKFDASNGYYRVLLAIISVSLFLLVG